LNIDEQVTQIKRLDTLGQLISNVEARLGQTISIMISEVEERLMERMQDKFTQINARLDTLGQLISNVEARLNGTDAGHADQDSSRTLDLAAWNAGFAAGEAGKPLTGCPYPARSTEALSWHSGFIEGRAKRQAVV
jgi:hypothetical protein